MGFCAELRIERLIIIFETIAQIAYENRKLISKY